MFGSRRMTMSIAFYNHDGKQFLISGSWDKSIRVWDTQTKEPLATTTDAHNDFVKTLLVIPTLRLLVSGGSDKIVRFWTRINDLFVGQGLVWTGSTISLPSTNPS
ncbi:hypothetical protein CC1G_05137 [Coprinopsis cinerea okayama7|uniref:Uncharacterized protein n=1 Tax=Coprinopsis cinerea (strain Okayama-7 / 130 / ATCC MYA-4618 / FGSC 9003) TaxID=240176 RepID=A8NFZ3_COPC7|nr:hypothetical protein CC1G_05137 [Coprinopsis cinerea okayama7\|eukprot:XP_001833437.2 hypothetical protein CC1G_05137 [Coprinopsis cinerea okayama7\